MDEAFAGSPDDTVSYKELLQSLSSAVALVEVGTWRILFENAKFFRWFSLEGDEADLLTTEGRLHVHRSRRTRDQGFAQHLYFLDSEMGERF
jgi:hypothetical protein